MNPRELLNSAGERLDDVARSPSTAKLVAGVSERIEERRRNSKLQDGTLRGVRVIVHHGWVAGGEARVLVRVVETPRLPEAGSRIPYWDVVQTNLRRHAALAFPGVTVTVHLGEHSGQANTDRYGFAAVTVPVPDLAPGWYEVTATAAAAVAPAADDAGDQASAGAADADPGQVFTGTGWVVHPDPEAGFAVISDIDDTVIRTGLDEGVTALRRTLFRDAETRRAIPGMASLYRGLARSGVDGRPAPLRGFFYVSTGSWSFYDLLTQFLQLRGFPRGPLFLTNWQPTDRYLKRSGAEHKRQSLARLHESYPDVPFVLIGDAGQADAQRYLEFARAHPESVRAIIIVRTRNDATAERMRADAATWREEGIEFHLAEDAREAAGVLHALGLCDALTLAEVEAEFGPVY